MTIIAALRESDDSILIAADSARTETPSGFRKIVDDKLQKHPSAPIAWGGAGNPHIAINGFW